MAIGVGFSVGPFWAGTTLGGRRGRSSGSGDGGGAAVFVLLAGLLVYAGVWAAAVIVWGVVWCVLAAWGCVGVVGRWLWLAVSPARRERAGGLWGVFGSWMDGSGEEEGRRFRAARWLWRAEVSQWLLLQRWGQAREAGWLRWLSAGAWALTVVVLVGGAVWATVGLETATNSRHEAEAQTEVMSPLNCGWKPAEQAACARAAGLEYPGVELAENYAVVGLCWSEKALNWVAC